MWAQLRTTHIYIFLANTIICTLSTLNCIARALSSRRRCFQLSTNFNKDFCSYL